MLYLRGTFDVNARFPTTTTRVSASRMARKRTRPSLRGLAGRVPVGDAGGGEQEGGRVLCCPQGSSQKFQVLLNSTSSCVVADRSATVGDRYNTRLVLLKSERVGKCVYLEAKYDCSNKKNRAKTQGTIQSATKLRDRLCVDVPKSPPHLTWRADTARSEVQRPGDT